MSAKTVPRAATMSDVRVLQDTLREIVDGFSTVVRSVF